MSSMYHLLLKIEMFVAFAAAHSAVAAIQCMSGMALTYINNSSGGGNVTIGVQQAVKCHHGCVRAVCSVNLTKLSDHFGLDIGRTLGHGNYSKVEREPGGCDCELYRKMARPREAADIFLGTGRSAGPSASNSQNHHPRAVLHLLWPLRFRCCRACLLHDGVRLCAAVLRWRTADDLRMREEDGRTDRQRRIQ
ncbi:hypothetical protein niasHT_008292 [Heterodera trifolii]|uniref:Uncharacterized protein n=1 Tax=Heterodera trifolii TaxID=157864 RepID=A0ABD2M1C1_9BILA